MTKSAHATFEVIGNYEPSRDSASARVNLSRATRRWSWSSRELARKSSETAHETRERKPNVLIYHDVPANPLPYAPSDQQQNVHQNHLFASHPSLANAPNDCSRHGRAYDPVPLLLVIEDDASCSRWDGYTSLTRMNLCLNLSMSDSWKREKVHPSQKP